MRRATSRVPWRWLQAMAACLLAVVVLGADASDARFNRIGHNMVCVCSCGQILLECNHVGCPDSGPMIGELQQQMSAGNSDTQIFNWFAGKYGAVVLASPMRGGFDTVAWVAPIAVFLLATIGTGVLVRVWTRRRGAALAAAGGHAPGSLGHSALRDRIRRETEY